MSVTQNLRLAVAGLGAIGMEDARAVDAGKVSGIELAADSAKNRSAALSRVSDFERPPEVAKLSQLASQADVIVECAPAAAFEEVARPCIAAGRVFMPLSVGALLQHMELIDQAAQTGARIIVPTGALIGLDTVRAMAIGTIHRVSLQTHKPPKGLAGAPYLVKNNISVDDLTEQKMLFKGNARQAAIGFPANVNVAAALALAGIGADDTEVEIWADPSIDRNRQSVTIQSDVGEASMTMSNIPSEENPRTGRIVANSIIASLLRLTSPMVVGS